MEYLKEPWDHQARGVNDSLPMNHFALLWEAGTGKTGACINMLRHKYAKHGQLLRTLILGPSVVVKNWRNEFLIHSKVPKGYIVPLYGPIKDRIQTMRELPKQRIVVTNYEGLDNDEFYKALFDYNFSIIVADESHRIKSHQSKRAKKCIALGDRAMYRYILTGSPVLRDALDLWSQCRFLDGGKTFGTNYYEYRGRYFEDELSKAHVKFQRWRPRESTYTELAEKLESLGSKVKKSECLDLPPLVKKVVRVELSTEQAVVYKAMKNDFVAYMNDKTCVATNAMVKGLRLQQIASGHMPTDEIAADGKARILDFSRTPRDKALRDILADLVGDHKVIVWAVFKRNYESIRKICDDMGIKYVEIHGEKSSKAKFLAMDDFNNDDSVRVLIGHPRSGGIGINLIAASYAIFYSRDFSLENEIQAEARNYRGGSEIHEKITRIDIVADETIDDLIMQALAGKKQVSAKILKDIADEL